MGAFLYLAYNILYPLLFLGYLPIMLFSPKNTLGGFFAGLKERFSVRNFSFKTRPIWFHASSVGEVKALRGLIERIKTQKPETLIFITCSTLAGRAQALEITEYASLICIDFYPLIKRMIAKVNPKKIIIMETELWPNFLNLGSKKTELFIINARISDRTIKRYTLIAPLVKFALRNVKKIMAQSQKDADRYAVFCAPEKISAPGNIKYDDPAEPPTRAEELRALLEKAGLAGKKIVVFGSTHPEEEKVIIKAGKLLKDEKIDTLFVVAPRHMSRLEETQALFQKEGASYIKWSEVKQIRNEKIKNNIDFILVDEMGLLVSFYSLCALSFVGGTLDNTGGHNLLEPSRFSKPVLFGPNYTNASQAGERLLEYRGGFVVREEYDLKGRMKLLLTDPYLLKQTGENSHKSLLSLKGATEKIISDVSMLD